MSDPTLTVRERAMRALVALFRDQEAGVPAADPYPLAWSMVERADVGARGQGRTYVLQVFETRENKTPLLDQKEAVLNVVLEWRARAATDCDPHEFGNMVMGTIQRRLAEDATLGGTALRVDETANDLNVDGWADKQVEGSVFLTVTYRHARRDPRLEC